MTDLSKYKAFPEDYVIPKDTQVIALVDDYGLLGFEGITTETSIVPFCNWKDGRNRIALSSRNLSPVNPQDHPDFKQEEPEWQPKTGEVVNVSEDKDEGQRIYLFTDTNGHWCVSLRLDEQYKNGQEVRIYCWKTISKYEPTPLKLTRAEIAEKFGTDNFEIID